MTPTAIHRMFPRRRARVRAALALTACILSAGAMGSGTPAAARKKAVPVILDTDIGPDVDDAGAAAVLNALADNGEARILAMGCCTASPWGAPCLDAINTYYRRPDVPLGTLQGKPGFLTDSRYNRQVAEGFPRRLRSGSDAEAAATLYRRVLARQPDRSVTMCAVGPLSNLQRLLESGPDKSSKLTGAELVAKKVTLLSVMGGRFPAGKEWNWEQDPPAATAVLAHWPTPMVMSGFEIGEHILTGKRLHTETPESNPVRVAFALFPGPDKDRESWDETAVLAAVRGAQPYWTLSGPGTVSVDARDGRNQWQAQPDGNRRYLITSQPSEQVKKALEDLMVQAPRH